MSVLTINRKVLGLCTAFIFALCLSAFLRFSETQSTALSAYSDLATPLYIGATIIFAILLTRAGVAFNRMGFGLGFKRNHLLLGLLGIAAVWTVSEGMAWVLDDLGLSARDLERFETVEGSLSDLITLLILTWTFAAVGEELAFRVILMRGLSAAFGENRTSDLIALCLQAVIFGLVHLYQGPAGLIGATVNGLIYGILVLKARGAIWPAVIAHGGINTIGLVTLYLGSV